MRYARVSKVRLTRQAQCHVCEYRLKGVLGAFSASTGLVSLMPRSGNT
jgi:hypothetical protein